MFRHFLKGKHSSGREFEWQSVFPLHVRHDGTPFLGRVRVVLSALLFTFYLLQSTIRERSKIIKIFWRENMKNVFNKNRESLLFYISNIECRLKQGWMPIRFLKCKYTYLLQQAMLTTSRDAVGTENTQNTYLNLNEWYCTASSTESSVFL